MTPKCCGMDSIWVENVPTKGYNYCRECKNEVVANAAPDKDEDRPNPDQMSFDFFFSNPPDDTY